MLDEIARKRLDVIIDEHGGAAVAEYVKSKLRKPAGRKRQSDMIAICVYHLIEHERERADSLESSVVDDEDAARTISAACKALAKSGISITARPPWGSKAEVEGWLRVTLTKEGLTQKSLENFTYEEARHLIERLRLRREDELYAQAKPFVPSSPDRLRSLYYRGRDLIEHPEKMSGGVKLGAAGVRRTKTLRKFARDLRS